MPTSTKRGPSAATRLLVATQTFLLLASLIVVLPTAAASRNAPPSAPPPSVEPSAQPTPAPTADPTAAPTPAPTADPTAQPRNPTAAPSASATTAPTQEVAPTASAKTVAPTKPGRTAPGHVSALAAAGSEIGWWKFDGNLTDSSTNANNGTGVGSPTFATGKVGQAVSLNGTSQWVSVADANSLDFTTGMTLAAWIRPTVTINTTQDVIKKASTTGTIVNGYELSLSSAGKVFVRLNNNAATRVDSLTSYPLNNTAWMHIAATYDGANLRLYINGTLEGTVATTTPIAVNSLPLALGAQSDNSRWFRGLLDDARVYATALSASEIADLVTPPAAAPVAVADSYSTPQNTALVQAAPGVLANDTDANGDPLTAVLDANVAHGTLALSANGGFTYTPTTGYSGPDSFTYHANDGTLNSNIVTVSLTVNAPAASLRGQWHFENNLLDSSTYSNNGTAVGGPLTYAAGQVGQALTLNGTTQNATVPDANSLDLTNALTIAAWIKPGLAATTQDLVNKTMATGTEVDGYQLALSQPGKVFVRFNHATSVDLYRVNSTTNYPTNGTTWMHVATTYDGTTIRLYINGVLEGSVAGPASIATNSLPLTIGAQSDNTRRFQGALDEVIVEARAMSASEIATLATPPAGNTAPVAVADSYSTPQNTALVQAAPGVLTNDTDADSNPLTAVLDTNVTHGALTLNANGGFTYTPTSGYSGPDSFTYHANDGTANSNIVTVSLTVTIAPNTSVSGTISKSGGAGPLVGSYVTAYEASSATWTNYAVTDASGAYLLNLPAGNYKLLIQTNTAGYPDTWYGGSTFASATVVVVDGAETVNVTIAPNTSVSGTISKSGGAGPLVGSYVTAYEASSATWTNYAVTDASGAYLLNLPAGNYKLLIQTNTAGYPDTWYGGSTFASATVVVVDGAETVNVTIAPNTSVSGTISKSGGAGPLVGSYVTAYEASSATWTNYAVTDASGAYLLNLPAGNYKLLIQTNTAGYPDTWYGGSTFASATVVVVDGAETVNVTIAPNTSVSGTISKSGGAGPLVGSYVTAYEASSATWTNYAVTDASGAYLLNLPAGNYKLLIQTNTAGYPDTWYGGSTFASATVVVVDGAETVNVTIAPNTSVSGTISKSGGAGPLVGSYVTAYEASSATWTNYAVTDASGAYLLNLPAGNYKLLIQTNTAGYPDTWYGGSTFASATVVVVDGAETVNVTVTGSGSNTAPVAVADSYSTPQNTALVQAAPGVLTNDTDADSNPLTAVLDTNVTHGALTLNANGGFTYTPTSGYSGPDSFTYHANDGTANSNIVTVSLTVNAAAGSLRGWWTMDGNANDSSGLANHASLIGSPTFVAGQVGQALSLNGTSQNASVPDNNSLDLTTGMTLATWIRPGAAATQDLIKKATNGATNGYELSLASPTSPAGQKVFVRLNQVTSGDTFRINSTTTYPTNGTWLHVAATYDGTTIKLYVNGTLEGSVAGPAAIATNTLPVGLGAQSDNTRWFTGLLDDARIYGSALTASEIAALAGVTPSGPPNAPTLNSPADGATGIGTSPTLSVGVSDPDANPMTVTFFGRPFGSGSFTQIGQNTGVASGTNTTTTWASLGAGQKFEWYATAYDGTSTTFSPTWTFNTAAGADPVFVGAGDIGSCDVTTDTDTGNVIAGIQGSIFTTGDNVYDFGTAAEFANCYAPTPWGSAAVKSRTRPVPGNHDWGTGGQENLTDYFAYFGANATDGGGKSYYSYNIAGSNWHVVNLDSECQLVTGGCGAGSAQDVWLEGDLAANSTKNVIAIWHKPRYSSGATNYQTLQPLWDDLYAAGVDILLDGHDHIYERTVPMKSGATLASPPVADPTYGIQQFTVGTGGEAHHGLATPLPTSVVRDDTTFGIMKFTLHATTYDWKFLPIAGSTFTDSGTGSVHGAPPAGNTAPVAVADSYSTPQNTALVQAAPGVLTNDTDADSNPLTAVLDTNVTHGALTLNANGGFTYTPTSGYSGPDSFTYHANDGTANSNIVTVSLTVNAAAGSLRGWWTMDGNANDSSGLANHASLIGSPTFVAGQVGQALSLNGTSQNASVPDNNSLDLTTGMTLATWIRPTVTVNTTQDVVKKATNGGVNGYELSLSSAGKVFVRLNQVTSADTYRINSLTSYPLNNTAWMHIAATYDGTTIKLYINGVQEGGNLAGPAAIVTNTLAVGLGAQSDNTRRFAGLLDDARIYGSALSASQIATLASTSPNGAPNMPTLNAPADGATGTGTSPTLSVGVTDPDSNTMTVTYFGRPFASGNFAQIAQNTGVATGTNSTTVWGPLGAGHKFEWYATVSDGMATTTGPTWTFNTAVGADPVFIGSGDIADCARTEDEATAAIVGGVQGNVWTTGDNVYQTGTAANYTNCYGPSWGVAAIKTRTRPVPGNHDWSTGTPPETIAPYQAYFGANATDAGGKTYYSYNIAGSNWHVVNLDSECQLVTGGCGAGSAQDVWLEGDLAANSTKNVIAIWHKPRYSSGVTTYTTIQPLWDDLYAAGVDLLLVGHDHNYERFAPMKSGATLSSPPVADPTYGIRQFTVGTGGENLSGVGTPLATSQVLNNTTFGVLKLTLHASTYDWAFMPIAGSTFTDSGTGSVHGAPPAGNVAPVAVADSYSTPQNTALVQAAPGILTNDTDGNGDPLTSILNVNVTHGALALNANGGFTYTPTAGYSGPDSFTYHANDGTANSNVVTVSLTVTATGATQQLNALAASASTSDKPQSKLWQNAGAWWMVAPSTNQSPAGTWIWKLVGQSWSPVIRLSTATDTHADVRAIGNVTHILLYGASPQLYSVQYNSSSTLYEPWVSRTTGTSITLTGSETATIDVDSQNRMWLATENGANLNVYYSDSPYTTFLGPVTLANNINGDDIGVVKALPNNTVGVLWSNQTTKRFGFKVHVDGAAPSTWSADELPASQSADDSLGAAFGMADDHMNVKVSSNGTLYAAVKTSYDQADHPKIALLIRRPNGTWDNLYEVDNAGTRPIVMINEGANLVRVVYSSIEGFSSTVYKDSPLNAISFGPRQTMMATSFNDVTSTKQNWTDTFVAVASDAANNIDGVIFSN